MKLEIHLDAYETYTNIGMAKAMVDSSLFASDLKEITEYLLIYCDNHTTEKGGVTDTNVGSKLKGGASDA